MGISIADRKTRAYGSPRGPDSGRCNSRGHRDCRIPARRRPHVHRSHRRRRPNTACSPTSGRARHRLATREQRQSQRGATHFHSSGQSAAVRFPTSIRFSPTLSIFPDFSTASLPHGRPSRHRRFQPRSSYRGVVPCRGHHHLAAVFGLSPPGSPPADSMRIRQLAVCEARSAAERL